MAWKIKMLIPYLALVQPPEGALEFRGVIAENAEQALAIVNHLLVENGQGESTVINLLSQENVSAFQDAFDQLNQVIAENPPEQDQAS